MQAYLMQYGRYMKNECTNNDEDLFSILCTLYYILDLLVQFNVVIQENIILKVKHLDILFAVLVYNLFFQLIVSSQKRHVCLGCPLSRNRIHIRKEPQSCIVSVFKKSHWPNNRCKKNYTSLFQFHVRTYCFIVIIHLTYNNINTAKGNLLNS